MLEKVAETDHVRYMKHLESHVYEIFLSGVPHTRTQWGNTPRGSGDNPLVVTHPEIPSPFAETRHSLLSFSMIPGLTADSFSTFHIQVLNTEYNHPNVNVAVYRALGTPDNSGTMPLKRIYYGSTIKHWGGPVSRSGKTYWKTVTNAALQIFSWEDPVFPGNTVMPYLYQGPMPFPATFEDEFIYAADYPGANSFGATAIDEGVSRLLNAQGEDLQVFDLYAKTHLYTVILPRTAIDMCLASTDCAYILLSNRIVILFDYVKGKMLGVSRVPSLAFTNFVVEPSIYELRMQFDRQTNRLYICEATPDLPDGTGTMRIVGYRMKPRPSRITTPIPLRWPRQRRTIPVLVSVVGDMNEGVGGYAMDVTVTGAASLAGVPITNNLGHAFVNVAIEGHPTFTGDPDEIEEGNPGDDPPNAGEFTVACELLVPPTPGIIPPVTPEIVGKNDPTDTLHWKDAWTDVS